MRTLNIKVDREVKLIFDNESWINMWEWTYSTNIEVGVLGVCHRVMGEDGSLSFYITNVYLPKQIANAAHWEVHPVEHGKQIVQRAREFGADAIQNAKFHYHSHNKMGVSPSSGGEYGDMNVRIAHTENFELGNPDHFFVFCIGNHAHDLSVEIYDYQTGFVYTQSDVDIYIEDKAWSSFDDDFEEAQEARVDTYTMPFNASRAVTTRTFTYPPTLDDDDDEIMKDIEAKL